MPDPTTTTRTDRPREGYHSALLAAHPDRPVRLFVPSDYQRKYAYPLVVLFHGDGEHEDTAGSLVTQLSRRNYIAACPRGPISLGATPTGRQRFAWGRDPQVDDYLIATVDHARHKFHIHPERVYLLGIGQGAEVASRVAGAMGDDLAGLVLLNNCHEGPTGHSLLGRKSYHGKRVFVGHGINNPVVPLSAARRTARVLSRLGADVQFASYPTSSRIPIEMLRDVNRWIMAAVNKNLDSLALPAPV